MIQPTVDCGTILTYCLPNQLTSERTRWRRGAIEATQTDIHRAAEVSAERRDGGRGHAHGPHRLIGAQQATPPETARPPATPVMTAAAEATPPAEVEVLTTDSSRVRLHGRRHQVARLRVRLRQSRLELPRPPRIDHQLRRQPEPRVHHVLPRGIVGGDGATATSRSKASRWPCWRTARSACSTRRWRSTTPGATACRSTSSSATTATPRSAAGVEWDHGVQDAARDGSRLHEVGRHAVVARRTSPSRRCAPTRSR